MSTKIDVYRSDDGRLLSFQIDLRMVMAREILPSCKSMVMLEDDDAIKPTAQITMEINSDLARELFGRPVKAIIAPIGDDD